jgi:hypothetical protein
MEKLRNNTPLLGTENTELGSLGDFLRKSEKLCKVNCRRNYFRSNKLRINPYKIQIYSIKITLYLLFCLIEIKV